ncbi:phage tail sheath subtilisin-like domain-containing protein [Herminiimonas arsenitoxidans]|uniref:phage tail sheath subtilisin-like domain-containing protein n=1 Tax=Herminiimonas arsenitoxidans TaxID=1809410 RepID=UPI0009707700|nr:phage tail sheath subtilisin-like domain-containing protein [Herminiimonas arsenitoxidans]
MASQNIAFEKIGSSNRKPSVLAEFNIRMATRGLPGNRQTTLIIGQKTAAGSLAALTLTNVFSDVEAAQLCGYGSQIHRMVLKTLKANKYSNISIMALADAAGVAASWPITVAGVPTAGGVFSLALNDDIIEVATATTDTPTTIAAAIVTAITSRPELAFSAENEAGVATIEAKNKGTVANAFKVTVAGTTPGITLSVGAQVPGTIDPDITAALTAAFIGGHDQVVIAYKDAPNVVALRNHIDAVSDPAEKRWALGFVGSNGSFATAMALSASIGHGFINNPWCRNTTTPTMEIAAAYAAVIAANEDPALGYDNVEVKGIAVPLVIDRTSRTEEESALYNGLAPLSVGPGERVQIVRAVTTYTVNAAAVPDVAWLDITTPRTMKYVAKVFIEDRARTYLGGKITDRRIAAMRDRGIVLLKMLEDLEIIEAVDDNLDDYIVERDLQDVSRVNERIPVDVVNNLHIIAERFDLLL